MAEQQYNDPGTTASSIGAQARTDFYEKKAIIAVRDKQYFSPLANVKAMPKNMGKKIKQDVYVPLLDDRNINDQGLNAAGLIITPSKWQAWESNGVEAVTGTGWNAPTATTAGFFATEANAQTAAGNYGSIAETGGHIYGSNKDIGSIAAKIPALSESGGRVNRIGFTRLQVEADLKKRGFFVEYTQESVDFDSDADLLAHITEESVVGANELTEAELQNDLLNTASGDGTTMFVTTDAVDTEIISTGDVGTKSSVNGLVVYKDLMRLSIALDDQKTPKSTKIISGSRMTDTKTINGGRIMYIGSEMIPALRAMVDLHSNPAFVGVEKYADAGNILNGEIGTVDNFRIVVVPEMQYGEGKGASNIDIYPMLVVGDGAFTTVGFQTDGKSVKFVINHKKPGSEISDLANPYGEKGFYSIKWYYGFLAMRPERLGVIWTKAD
jgi:N4-gp56 family major capsid protein